MIKKISIVFGVLLVIGSVTFGLVRFPNLFKGYEGYWYGGAMENGKYIYRASFHFQKDSDGNLNGHYNMLEYGQYDKPFTNFKQNGRDVYCEIGPAALVLHLDPKGEVLTGTATTKGKQYVLTFHRGMNFFLPRVGENGLAKTSYTYAPPQKMNDGWEVGDLRADKVNIAPVEDAVKRVLGMELSNVHSLVVVKKGKLVLDEYFCGYGPDDEHQLRSVTKSILSALFGIEADQGLVKTTDKLYDQFPDYRKKLGWEKKKNKITLGMMLSMTSGLGDEDNPPGQREYVGLTAMYNSPDWLWDCLTQRMTNTPGKHWAYSSENVIPLGDIVARKGGMSVPDFAQKYLYAPLGIQAKKWTIGPNGVAEVEGSHWLRPRDMAKIGLLYLQKGKWNGKQVISEKWVDESTSFKSKTNSNYFDYGYFWWLGHDQKINGKPTKIFTAMGRGGQFIMVVPEYELVLVTTAGNYDDAKSSSSILSFLGLMF